MNIIVKMHDRTRVIETTRMDLHSGIMLEDDFLERLNAVWVETAGAELSDLSYAAESYDAVILLALASLPLAAHVKAVHEWHINADEPLALQYTLAYKSADQH